MTRLKSATCACLSALQGRYLSGACACGSGLGVGRSEGEVAFTSCRVMTTLMRNGRDRRSGKPGMGHATLERVFLFGTRSADHIMASGHSGCVVMGTSSPFENRPDTWLHRNASRSRVVRPGEFMSSRPNQSGKQQHAKANRAATLVRAIRLLTPCFALASE
jgi:hypothetical protein